VSLHLRAEQLTAGRDINLNQHYHNSQNTGTPPRTVQEDISALLTKLHSRSVPLSQCLAEGFSLAVKIRNQPLEEFCRRELEGWKFNKPDKVKFGGEYPKYRSIDAYVSFTQINPAFVGWQGSVDNALAYRGCINKTFHLAATTAYLLHFLL
jgi:hypothetical protein